MDWNKTRWSAGLVPVLAGIINARSKEHPSRPLITHALVPRPEHER
jgi:hypothetical protein